MLAAMPIIIACQQPGAAAGSKAAPVGKEAATAEPLSQAAQTGKQLFVARGCVACHRAPGIPEAQGTIGPNLRGVGNRAEHPKIAGTIDNTTENMVRWLMNPPALKPGTAMPNIGLSEEDARNLTALLESFK